MRYWVYDDEGILLRKFYTKEEAQLYGKVIVQPKQKKVLPTIETHGEALW